MTAGLERSVRLLLHAYPTGYRTSRGDEILATVLDTARPGQRLPDPADAADLVRAGLRERLAAAGPAFADGARAAAPFALALAGGVSAYLWWRVEPTTVHTGWSYLTAGPLAYAAWLLALAVRLALPVAAARPAVIAALTLTVASPAVAAATRIERPPLWTLALLVALGALASAAGPATVDERLALPAGAVAICVVAATLRQLWPPGPGAAGYYQPREIGAVVAATATLLLALALLPRPGRSAMPVQPRVLGAALLAVPVTWLGPYAAVPPFGRLAEVLLGSCAAATALLWLSRRHVRSGRIADPAAAPSAAVGVAGALGGFLAGTGSSPYAWRTVAVVGLAGVLGCLGARRLRAGWLVTGAVVGALAAWAVAVYANSWQLTGWTRPTQTAQLVATIAFVPLSACVVTAVRGLPRPVPAATVLTGVSWLVPATLPYALSWGPQLAVLVACLAVSAMSRPADRVTR